MGLIVCEIHGTTGIALVSSDIEKDFVHKVQYPPQKVHQIKVNLFDHPTTFCWLSSEVAARFNIPLDRILSLDEFDSYGELPLEPVCGECFLEWLNKSGGT